MWQSSFENLINDCSSMLWACADFPKPGILFWDVTTLLLDHTAFKYSIDLLHEQYKDQKIDVVAGEPQQATGRPVLAACSAQSLKLHGSALNQGNAQVHKVHVWALWCRV
jgi:adenine/guanine phosphoribosyltransferase-like PRPP-binding protein